MRPFEYARATDVAATLKTLRATPGSALLAGGTTSSI